MPPSSDGTTRRRSAESIVLDLRSRELRAWRLDSDSSVGDREEDFGTTKVVIWSCGAKGEDGDFGAGSVSALSALGGRGGSWSLPVPKESRGRSLGLAAGAVAG